MASIKSLPTSCRQELACGTVILDVAGAIKELVENSIDAGATSIDIRLLNYGADLVEVVDDGRGVDEAEMQSIARAHFTSKIESIDDLQSNIGTFGFRGEALNAAANISHLTISSRHSSSPSAVECTYDHSGSVTSRSSCARGSTGMTVRLRELFVTRPVRRKHLLGHLRANYTRVLKIIETYALLATVYKIRLVCTHRLNLDSARTTVLLVDGRRQSWRECFAQVFGDKASLALVDVEQRPISDAHKEMHEHRMRSMWGYASSTSHGSGRSSSDRQFVFVNGRPVDLPAVNKVVNEEYSAYNNAQKPTFALYFTLPNASVDVNRVPDKREVFVVCEAHMLAVLRSCVSHAFEGVAGSCPTVPHPPVSLDISLHTVPSHPPPPPRTTVVRTVRTTDQTRTAAPPAKQRKLNEFRFEALIGTPPADEGEREMHDVEENKENLVEPAWRPDVTSQSLNMDIPPNNQVRVLSPNASPLPAVDRSTRIERQDSAPSTTSGNSQSYSDESSSSTTIRPTPKLRLSIDDIVAEAADDAAVCRFRASCSIDGSTCLAVSTEAMLGDDAERRLEQVLDKEHFSHMRLVGQFNKGFIIARLDDHLFIVDQHASDEKYNFEQYMAHGSVHAQQMIRPVPMDLSRASETVLRDEGNLRVLNKCGFQFDVDGEKCLMTAAPSANGHVFNRQDVDDMLAVLADAPGVLYRPARLRKVFASKACRKSVMIGTALTKPQMSKILLHLSSLHNPWNCPHGRPTLRHLVDVRHL